MKNLYRVVICLFSTLTVSAQLPNLQWAKNIGGARGLSVKSDAAGNVYTTGYFGGVGDFDPGPGTFFLTADGGDAYVSKLDANGNFMWAVLIGGDSGSNQGVSVLPDAAGNVYIAGYFSGTVDFDPGPATFNITTNGQNDIFIVKLDGNGNFIWANRVGGTSSDLAYAATLDPSGNICVTGVFIGTVDFDPGPGVANMVGGGFNRCFILKLDANGNYIQAQQIAAAYSEGDAVTTDAAGNIFVCGVYTSTADLNPGPGVFNVTATSGADAFIVKLDNTGNFVWGKSIGSLGTDNCRTIKADTDGNVYVAGDFPFTTDFDPGPAVFNITAAGTSDGYVLKLNTDGDFVWAKVLGGTAADAARDITLDAAANVYVTGLFQATADFDPGPGVFNLTVTGGVSNDVFITKLTSTGDFVWALNYGGNTLDEGLSLFCSPSGNLYATGYFAEVVDFDPGAGTSFLNSADGKTYIVNLGAGNILPLTLLSFSAYSTPAGNQLQWKTAQEINTNYFEIEWSTDGVTFVKIAQQQAVGSSSSVLNYNYLHNSPANGNNYYRLKMVDTDGRFTYSPVIKLSSTFTSPVLAVYPNPVIDVLNIDIKAAKNETLSIRLYNTEGKLVDTRQFNVVKGSNVLAWNISQLPAGRYFINDSKSQFKATGILKQ